MLCQPNVYLQRSRNGFNTQSPSRSPTGLSSKWCTSGHTDERTWQPEENCRKRSVLGFEMSRYDGTKTAVIVDLFETVYKRWNRWLLHAPRRACTSATTVEPAFNPSSNGGTAVIIKQTIICRRLVASNTHRTDQASIQIVTISEDVLGDGVRQTVE